MTRAFWCQNIQEYFTGSAPPTLYSWSYFTVGCSAPFYSWSASLIGSAYLFLYINFCLRFNKTLKNLTSLCQHHLQYRFVKLSYPVITLIVSFQRRRERAEPRPDVDETGRGQVRVWRLGVEIRRRIWVGKLLLLVQLLLLLMKGWKLFLGGHLSSRLSGAVGKIFPFEVKIFGFFFGTWTM